VKFIVSDPQLPAPDGKVLVFTLEAARRSLEELLQQPDGQEYNTPACHQLVAWLRAREQGEKGLLLN
jgi:hypothetical protein